MYRVGDSLGGYWSLDPPPPTEYQWRIDYAIKQDFTNSATNLYRITIPKGSSITALDGTVGSQGLGLYGGAHQAYIDIKQVPDEWIDVTTMRWRGAGK